jgi:ComF family protein
LRIIKEALEIMFPKECLICGKISDIRLFDAPLCKKCLTDLVPVPSDKRWQFCLSEPFENDPCPSLTLYVPFKYEGRITSLIHRIKFGHKRELTAVLGTLLGKCLINDNVSCDAVIPIPLSEQRLSERGFNQAELISLYVSNELNIPLLKDVLVRSKNTLRQAEIKDNLKRAANMSGAFRFNDEYSIDGLSILLIDDVATTGNTLHEAAEVLIQNGASKVLCCAFASNRSVKNVESY